MRSPHRGFALVLLLALPALAAPRAASAQGCQTLSSLVYATVPGSSGPRDLHLDLVLPASATAPLPVVLWVHGGGWSSGSHTPVPSHVASLCPRGYAVASLEYRLSTEALWPAQIQDLKGAVRWLRAHAAEYGLDPDRFAAWGDSAGGHLAAMLGTTGGAGLVTVGDESADLEGSVGGNPGLPSRVQAVVDWYGATDFLQLRFYPTPAVPNHDAAGSAESRLLGGPIQDRPERAATASPVFFATADDPPFLLMHGTTDRLYPFNQSELLADALAAAGVEASLVPVVNGGHGGTLFTNSSSLQVVYDFLDRALGGARPVVSVEASDAAASEAGGDGGAFTVRRTGSTAAPLTVRLVPGGGARPGADYAAPAATLTLPAGVAEASVAVSPLDDLVAEGDEAVVLALASDPAYRVEAARAAATVALADDDATAALPAVEVVASDGSAAETGPDPGELLVTRSGGTAADLTVRYRVAGTAEAGADYAALPGEVLIPAGASEARIPVVPAGDDPGRAESAETVIVTLEPGADYALGERRSAGIAIAPRDEAGRPTVSVSAIDRAAAEPGTNAGTFLVTRTGSTSAALTVSLAAAGSAQPGADYAALPATVTFAAGADRTTVAVTPADDFTAEPAETVEAAVAPAAGIALGPYRGSRVAIADDDVPGLPVLAALAAAPAAPTGGQAATGTVTLDRPAPAGGVTVSLASSAPAAAKVPASVAVPGGASSATFTATTYPVAAATGVTLTASYRGVARTASLTVQPPVLSGLTLTPASLPGGCRTSTGKVTLTGKAPAGGIAVALGSANPAASVPASVTVAAGASSASFTIATSAVTASTAGAVSASQGGVTKSATLTVRPVGLLSLALAPNPVTGPAEVTATVTLECPAAPGDVAVAVTSSSSAVARPAVSSVTVPAGATTATFAIAAADVGAVSTATIRVTASGTAKSVTLTVNP